MRLHKSAWLLLLLSPHLSVAGDPSDFEAAQKTLAKLEEVRRQEAAVELEHARQQLAQLEERAKAMQAWTQVQFRSDFAASPRTKSDSAYGQRLREQRQKTLGVLLEFPDRANGAVKSGRALNFFLDECGPAAFELIHYRGLASEGGRLEADEIKRELLSGLSTNYKIDEKIIRHVSVLRGETGLKLTGRLNTVPLDLERVPSVLRQDEFKAGLERIRTFRDAALRELEDGQPVSAGTARELMDAVDSLLADIRIAKRKHAKEGFNEYRPYMQAHRHMRLIFAGASRLIEAYEADDVLLDEFKGGNIEELLAYMHRNNLHFGAADDNADSDYRLLFELLAKYYCDLCTLQKAADDNRQQIAQGKQRERELEDIKLGISLNNFQKAELAAKGLDALGKGLEAFGKAVEKPDVVIVKP